MATSSPMQFVLYLGLVILAVTAFYLLAWKFQPDYLRASVQPLRDLAAWWHNRKQSVPDGPAEQDIWMSYLEAATAIASLEAIRQIMDGQSDMSPEQLKLFKKSFDVAAARRTALGIAVNFFSSMTEADVNRLAEAVECNHQGRKRPTVEAIADFLKKERASIAANRHLIEGHVERMDEFLGGGQGATA